MLVRNYRGQPTKPKWQSGTIEKRSGPVNYVVKTDQNYTWRRHANQIINTGPDMNSNNSDFDIETATPTNEQQEKSASEDPFIQNPQDSTQENTPQPLIEPLITTDTQTNNPPQNATPSTPVKRRSTRDKKIPERFGCAVTDLKTWK